MVLMLIVMGQLCGFSFAFVTGLCLLRLFLLVSTANLAGVGLSLLCSFGWLSVLVSPGIGAASVQAECYGFFVTGAAWLSDGSAIRM